MTIKTMKPVSVETDRYLDVSAKVEEEDLDWNQARLAGISETEKFVLTYFSDIEGQTIVYLRDLLHTEAGLEPDVIAFLSMWNYEEFFHGRLLAKFMKECGSPLDENRIAQVRKSASFSEKLESVAANILSRIFRPEFPAVYTTWGAVQELTTLRGYEKIQRTTANPVLKTICERIAKQERRHYAWYFNSARERLERSPRAQKLTRFLLERFWTPVGAGVKPPQVVARLFGCVFPDIESQALAAEIDEKFSTLPGLEGIRVMRPYLEKMKTHYPELISGAT
jgi:rubrerythrin